jgi:hypothetical protein
MASRTYLISSALAGQSGELLAVVAAPVLAVHTGRVSAGAAKGLPVTIAWRRWPCVCSCGKKETSTAGQAGIMHELAVQ